MIDGKTYTSKYLPIKLPVKDKVCISCGTANMGRRRRFCSDECRDRMHWVLKLSTGLLKACSTRYAAFSFTDNIAILDILPTWSDKISRFISLRKPGSKPADDLKYIILNAGRKWHEMVKNKASWTVASMSLLEQNIHKGLKTDSVTPGKFTSLRCSNKTKKNLKILELAYDDVAGGNKRKAITSAFRRLAKRFHPDMGGTSEDFNRILNAHEQILSWSRNKPGLKTKMAIEGGWSYNGYDNKWTPPF